VYQDLALCDDLDVASNLVLGREPRTGGGMFLDKRRMHAEARHQLDALNIRIPLTKVLVRNLSGGQRQAVAVVRAEAFAGRMVILDEPTAALGLRESKQVLSSVSRLRDRGLAVILISHNLEHVIAVADRAVVLSRGRNVGEAPATADHQEQLVSWIVSGHARADS
jgi:ABC-type sugar transport system ATPase subunit